MITKLLMANVKGISREFDLAPVTLVQGGNYTGKTAMAQAIRIGLLGYDPRLGKLASATYGLASGERMQIGLEFEAGEPVTRAWAMRRGKLVSEGAKEPLTEPMLLDIDQYFSLTKQARIDYVMGLAAEGGIESKHIDAALHAVRQPIDPAAKEHQLGQLHRMTAQCEELIAAADQEGLSCKEVVDALLLDWTEQAKATKGVIAQMTGATQATEQLSGDEPEARSQTTAIEEKQNGLALLEQAYAVTAERAKIRWKLERAVLAAEQEAKLADNAEHLEELRRQIADLRAEHDKEPIYQDELPKLTKAVQTANDRAKAANKAATEADQDVFKCDNELARWREILKNQRELSEVKECRLCGAAKEHWHKEKKDYKADIQASEDTIAKLEEQLEKLREDLATKNDDALVCQRKAEAAAKALENLYNRRDRGMERALKIGELEKELAAAGEAGTKLAGLRKQLEENGTQTATELDASAAEIRRTIEVARGELSKLQAEQNRYARQCQQKLHAEEAAAEREKREQILEVLQSGIEQLKSLKETAAERQWGSFIKTINSFTQGILKEPIAFYDGELGYWSGKRWVGHETMSGIEQALVYMGLGVALAAKSKLHIVVMDEMGILDRVNEFKVIDRMRELQVNGVIDQFVGMTSREVADIDGVEMIRL